MAAKSFAGRVQLMSGVRQGGGGGKVRCVVGSRRHNEPSSMRQELYECCHQQAANWRGYSGGCAVEFAGMARLCRRLTFQRAQREAAEGEEECMCGVVVFATA